MGILCVLIAMVAIMGHWVDRGYRAGPEGLGGASVGVIGGTGSKKLTDTDSSDEDLERAKTYQYMMLNKAQPPGGGLQESPEHA